MPVCTRERGPAPWKNRYSASHHPGIDGGTNPASQTVATHRKIRFSFFFLPSVSTPFALIALKNWSNETNWKKRKDRIVRLVLISSIRCYQIVSWKKIPISRLNSDYNRGIITIHHFCLSTHGKKLASELLFTMRIYFIKIIIKKNVKKCNGESKTSARIKPTTSLFVASKFLSRLRSNNYNPVCAPRS